MTQTQTQPVIKGGTLHLHYGPGMPATQTLLTVDGTPGSTDATVIVLEPAQVTQWLTVLALANDRANNLTKVNNCIQCGRVTHLRTFGGHCETCYAQDTPLAA